MSNSKQKWLNILKKARIFYGLSSQDIELLASAMFYAEFDENRVLVYEGDPGNELFIIVEGEISVSVSTKEKEIELIRLKAGDFFGEMALLEQENRSATCKAIEQTSCLVLKSQDFSSFIIEQPEIAASVLNNMLKITGSRLMNTSTLLSQMIQWGDGAKKRAITDSFTGLYNRRYLDESFETLVQHSIRQHLAVSFAMVDVDHFGTLNRTYGPEFCDKVLLEIARVFKESFDSDDILIRYGGDEFCFIICGKFERGQNQCKKVCIGVNALHFDKYPDLKVSCSIGITQYKYGMTTNDLLQIADKALYKAKEAGRNQVVAE